MLYILWFPKIMTTCAFCICEISSHGLMFMAEHIFQMACKKRENLSFVRTSRNLSYSRRSVAVIGTHTYAHVSHSVNMRPLKQLILDHFTLTTHDFPLNILADDSPES